MAVGFQPLGMVRHWFAEHRDRTPRTIWKWVNEIPNRMLGGFRTTDFGSCEARKPPQGHPSRRPFRSQGLVHGSTLQSPAGVAA